MLVDGDLVLRPMTEGDWDVVLEWADDPEVLYFSEGDSIDHRPKEEHQAIYRAVSVTPADMFVFEVNGEPMGDGWLQHMNLARVLDAHPGKECRRVDLELERFWWGKGIGTRAIRLLTAHGFRGEPTWSLRSASPATTCAANAPSKPTATSFGAGSSSRQPRRCLTGSISCAAKPTSKRT